MKFISRISAVLLVSLFQQLGFAQCPNSITELEIRYQQLEKATISLNSLVGLGSQYNIPLTTLFQIDTTDSLQVEKRELELHQLLIERNIVELPIYKPFASCKDTATQEFLHKTIQLQKSVNQQKLAFLKLKTDQKIALVNAYNSQRQSTNANENLKSQLAQSQSALNNAQKELLEREDNPIESAENLYKTSLDRMLVEIEAEHIAFIEKIENDQNKIGELQKINSQLSKLLLSITKDNFDESYYQITTAWESAVDNLLHLFSQTRIESKINISKLSTSESYDSIIKRQQELLVARGKILDSLKVQNFRLLQDLGVLRTKLLSICDEYQCDSPWQINQRNINTFLREIRVVPLKFVAGTLGIALEFKSKSKGGFDGWLDLSRQSLLLLTLLLIPFFLTKAFRWLSLQLEVLRGNLVSKSMLDYKNRTGITFWISRLTPFIPSGGMILSLYIARMLIINTDFSDLSHILFYIQFFFIYRFSRQLLMLSLEYIFSINTAQSTTTANAKISKSATRISRLVFIQYLLLYLIEDTVRKALAYHLFSNLIFWINIFFLFYEVNNWKVEIQSAFSLRLPTLWSKLQKYADSRISLLLLPFLFVAVVINDIIRISYSYLSQLDIVKRLLSEILKKRLERIEKPLLDSKPPPSDYLKHFDYYLVPDQSCYISPQASASDEALKLVSSWSAQTSSNDLAILVGNRGLGKTSTLSQFAKESVAYGEVILSRLPAKILSDDALYQWLSKLLSTPISSIEDFKNFDLSLNKKIILCVDDVHNLFLCTLGGLKAYKTFLEIISLKSKNAFWCLTINSRSWTFLKGILGNEHFYGQVINIRHWKDFEIKNLILTRHQISNFSLKFDITNKVYGSIGSLNDAAEAQFFRLLWGQSRGNPRSALMYWVSALSTTNANEISVGVPTFISSDLVATMSDDALFLLSAITKHDSLTHEELRQITGIDDLIIRKCLKEAEDKQLIWQDSDDRIRISSRAQYVVDYFLIGKNFLYE